MRFAVLALVLVASASFLPASAQVAVDYDREVDFSAFKSYAWGEGTPAASPFVQKRIVDAIDAALQEKGLEKVEEGADLQVITHASVSSETQVRVDDFGYWRRYRGFGTTQIDVDEVKVGTLIVDLVQTDGEKLLWRGTARDTVAGKPEQSEKKIRKAVAKLFKKFPPETKEK